MSAGFTILAISLIDKIVDVASNAAAAPLLIWLLSRGELFTDLPTVLGERFGWSGDWSVPTALVAACIVVITLLDSVKSVVKARAVSRGDFEVADDLHMWMKQLPSSFANLPTADECGR